MRRLLHHRQGGLSVSCHAGPPRPRGFTLIELLVVIFIILLVSVLTLGVYGGSGGRAVGDAARLVQAELAGARDAAARSGRPAGIRLLPDSSFTGINRATGLIDPSLPLAYSHIIPIGLAPDYSEGLASVFPETPGASYPSTIHDPTGTNHLVLTPTLVLEEQAGQWIDGAASGGTPVYSFMPNPPTNWFWNIRVGDKVQLNHGGPWYTVVGPMWTQPTQGNAEMSVNVGPPGVTFKNVGLAGATSPLVRTYTAPDGVTQHKAAVEYLLLVNGADDNANGWVDEGWDGVDNDADGVIDNGPTPTNKLGEWEVETWHGIISQTGLDGTPYVIRRRPLPELNVRSSSLPSGTVIDATTWGTTLERSRLPAPSPYTGYADILVNPDGTIQLSTVYGSRSSFGMSNTYLHFWIAARNDVVPPTGSIAPFLPVPPGADLAKAPTATLSQPLKGNYAIVTVFPRMAKISTVDDMPFDLANAWTASYNPNQPFLEARQGY